VLRDQQHIGKTLAYFEVYRPLRVWNMRQLISDFVAPLVGNRRCHGNHFVH